VGDGVVGERLDDRPAAADLVEGFGAELDGGAAAGDGDDLGDAERADADGDGGDLVHRNSLCGRGGSEDGRDDLPAGTRILLIDDVLATGGTLAAGREIVKSLGYTVAGISVLFEIDGLGGRDVIGDLHTVFRSA